MEVFSTSFMAMELGDKLRKIDVSTGTCEGSAALTFFTAGFIRAPGVFVALICLTCCVVC